MKARFPVNKLLFIIAILICMFSAYAHPGSTDYNGGHVDRSTGKYHYHHGYSAHQHENGVCPYDFDDKTDRSYYPSSSSSSNISHSSKSAKSKTVFDYFMSGLCWTIDAIKWLLIYGGALIVPGVLVIVCAMTVFFKIKDFFSR